MAVNSIEFIIERLQLPLNYGLSIDTWRISYISKLKGNHFVLFSFINCAIILIFRWDIGKSVSLVWRGKVSLWHYVYGKHSIFSLNALKWREMSVSLLSNQSGNFFPNCLGKWSAEQQQNRLISMELSEEEWIHPKFHTTAHHRNLSFFICSSDWVATDILLR